MPRDVSLDERADVALLPRLPFFRIAREKCVGEAAAEPKGLDFDSPPTGHFGKQERSEFQDVDATGKRLRNIPDEFRADRAEQEEAAMSAARLIDQGAQYRKQRG